MYIYADYEQIASGIKGLSAGCTDLKQELEELLEAADSLDIFWDGDAGNAFNEAFAADMSEAAAYVLKLRKYIKKLDSAVSDYQETEMVVSSIIGGINL